MKSISKKALPFKQDLAFLERVHFMKMAFHHIPRRPKLVVGALTCLVILITALVINSFFSSSYTHAQTTLPTPSHVVLVIEENHSYNEIIGSSSAPYINSLANTGASFTRSFAVTHPSEPNYLALYSGSTQGITDDSCPHTFGAPDLGGELIQAGLSFGGYSESLPSTGSMVCSSGSYARKHNPWVNFTDVPASDNMPFTSFPSTNFSSLPTISIVVPNLLDDMHDGTIQQGDSWLQQNIDSYVQWAKTNNSLLIVTWDEDDSSQSNQIPTIFVGPMVQSGQYSEQINHYNVLRTLEDMYGLPAANNSASATAITYCWQSTSTPTPGSTPTPTPSPTPIPGGVSNGGFETGNFSGWTTSGTTAINTTAHSGNYSAQAGSTSPTSGDSTISQTFTIPGGVSSLSFWYQVHCADKVRYDWANATLKDNTTNTTRTILSKTCTNNGAWVQVTVSVTAGHSNTLTLLSHDDNRTGNATYTLFDDVSLS